MIKRIKSELKQATFKDWVHFLLIIGIMLLVFSLAIKYFLEMLYLIDIGTDPCGLCTKLNPHIELVNRGINIKDINWSNITIASP